MLKTTSPIQFERPDDNLRWRMIREIKKYPCLWAKCGKHAGIAQEKKESWRKLAMELQQTVEFCLLTWKSLRDSYRVTKARAETSIKIYGEEWVPSWQYFSEMAYFDESAIEININRRNVVGPSQMSPQSGSNGPRPIVVDSAEMEREYNQWKSKELSASSSSSTNPPTHIPIHSSPPPAHTTAQPAIEVSLSSATSGSPSPVWRNFPSPAEPPEFKEHIPRLPRPRPHPHTLNPHHITQPETQTRNPSLQQKGPETSNASPLLPPTPRNRTRTRFSPPRNHLEMNRKRPKPHNSDDSDDPLVSTSTSSPKLISRQQEKSVAEVGVEPTTKKDSLDSFGHFITASLREIPSPRKRERIKLRIHQVMAEELMEDSE